MKFTELTLKGAYLIEAETHSDVRGTFTRQFCKKEFLKNGIRFDICQCNISANDKKNTLRGLHFHKMPYEEAKVVSCFRGSCFDVIVDLRKNSPSYLSWESVELNDKNNKMLYIPSQFAHGFQTLEDNTIIYYQLNNYYKPEFYDGIRWDDPKIGIKWPNSNNLIINERDKSYKFL